MEVATEPDSDGLREELQRSRDEFPPHDSEDSLGPEYVENEQMMGSASTREPMEGATAPDSTLENHGPYAHQVIKKESRSTIVSRPTHVSHNYLVGT